MDNQAFLEKQKTQLLKEKENIESKIKQLKKYPSYGDDEEDNLQEISDFESNLSIEGQLEVILEKIDNALAAIEAGTYGLCSKCKKAIDEDRLEIMPYADICVKCQVGK